MRGGEAVLEAILELFPQADLYTLLYNPGSVSDIISKQRIVTSFIDRLPFKSTRYRYYLPFFPAAAESFDFNGYDLVISSSHCVARGVIVPPGTPHISYFHTPMRYVWDMYQSYFPPRGLMNRTLVPFIANYLRMWDVSAAPRVDSYLSNSAFVGERIRRFYGRSSTVVHPPCLKERRRSRVVGSEKREDFYLVVSAFAPYKRVDLALEAFRDWGRRLLVVGSGQDEKKLLRYKLSNVRFQGNLSREGVENLYRTARGLIFPGREDFGIVPVEAQSFGCPVIAYGSGGALETVVSGKTGVFFQEQTADAVREAVLRHENIRYKNEDFEKNVSRFTDMKFKSAFLKEVKKLVN